MGEYILLLETGEGSGVANTNRVAMAIFHMMIISRHGTTVTVSYKVFIHLT